MNIVSIFPGQHQILHLHLQDNTTYSVHIFRTAEKVNEHLSLQQYFEENKGIIVNGCQQTQE